MDMHYGFYIEPALKCECFLPEQSVHVKGWLFEWEPVVEHPLLSGPQSQGFHVQHRVAADVRSQLVGKAKRHNCK